MSIIVFSDVILPASVIAAGVRGRQRRRTSRASTQGGHMQANVLWSRTLRQYEIGYIPMLAAQWLAIEGLHEVTEGGAYGFLLVDPKDSSATHTDGMLYPSMAGALAGTSGTGYGVPSYKLHKRYTSSGSTRTKDRSVTRPKSVIEIKRGGSTVTLGAGPGQASVDYDTGTVTFVADSSSTVTAITAGASTQVTLTAALSGVAIGERLYLSGIGGADAALLNGLSHAITGISSNTYTLSTNTAGKTLTVAGSGYAYPQSTETLTWQGDFYVPVHFAGDEIDWELVRSGPASGRLIAGPSVLLDEVRE